VSSRSACLDLFTRGTGEIGLLRIVQGSTHIRFTAGQSVLAAAQSMLLAASALVARADRIHLGPGVMALAGIADPSPFECETGIQEAAAEQVAIARLVLAGRSCAPAGGLERITQ
jgi:hypothetical protein